MKSMKIKSKIASLFLFLVSCCFVSCAVITAPTIENSVTNTSTSTVTSTETPSVPTTASFTATPIVIPTEASTDTPSILQTPEIIFSDGGFTNDGLDRFSRPSCDSQYKNSSANGILQMLLGDKLDSSDDLCILIPNKEYSTFTADKCPEETSCLFKDYSITSASVKATIDTLYNSGTNGKTPAFGFAIYCNKDDFPSEAPDYSFWIRKMNNSYNAKYYYNRMKNSTPFGGIPIYGKSILIQVVMSSTPGMLPDTVQMDVSVSVGNQPELTGSFDTCANPDIVSFGTWVSSGELSDTTLNIYIGQIEYSGVLKPTSTSTPN